MVTIPHKRLLLGWFTILVNTLQSRVPQESFYLRDSQVCLLLRCYFYMYSPYKVSSPLVFIRIYEIVRMWLYYVSTAMKPLFSNIV